MREIIQFPVFGWGAPQDTGIAHWLGFYPCGGLAGLCRQSLKSTTFYRTHALDRSPRRCTECQRLLASGQRLPVPFHEYTWSKEIEA